MSVMYLNIVSPRKEIQSEFCFNFNNNIEMNRYHTQNVLYYQLSGR